ncbi:FAD dependent oxidoreductase [Fodinibius roseus]|uniref:FAD dependent oxidoreductase n=1 Tax=Fodinibius roseus TaxID=1194090 RepID=A0A1M5FY50_9BACT|nr:FAD-dependent oxidoreductase [Fodinibius roseus]SHF96406.1 FAD dependent oxidoreductase [Fodinibius roseus]
MIKKEFVTERSVKTAEIESDLVVVGGGMAGVCCSLTAARAGIKVTLVQDRPVLGGNASSEVRLWILGATSSMGNNNRWAREGGVIDEILLENVYRNPEGNAVIFDTILLEKVSEESNITLLLNTAVYEVEKAGKKSIKRVIGFCSQNSTKYELAAPLFCDSSGDGIMAFQAGAPFRMGAEKKEEFDEGFAPDVEDYGELLGHSIYFYTKDAGKPVDFIAPSFALQNPEEFYKIRNFDINEHGCQLWWVEYGGRLDTVHQSEEIKWELWKVIYGIWDYVKNSGNYPDAQTLTLEWVGTIPGKRESRRFEGDYILTQKDIVEQSQHYDAVAFGGWSLDLHHADGIYSGEKGCNQWHSKGVYQIPYRCYYSRSIDNLFFSGRIISASHVAFGSSRVMATCAHGAQAVGMAAALATKHGIMPKEVGEKETIKLLQKELNKRGQSIPLVPLEDEENLINKAELSASDELNLTSLPKDGPWLDLNYSSAQMLPFKKNTGYKINFDVKASKSTTLEIELRTSSEQNNYTPDIMLEEREIHLEGGKQNIELEVSSILDREQYVFICLMKNEDVSIKTSEKRISGLLTVFNKPNKAVSNNGRQDPPDDIGVDSFEFWIPERRPGGKNFGFDINPGITSFNVSNVNNGYTRPTFKPNAWIAHWENKCANIAVKWKQPEKINTIILMFDTDFDHPLESTLRGHEERVMPFCIQNFKVFDNEENLLYEKEDNYQTISRIDFNKPIITDSLKIVVERPSKHTGAAVFELLCYGQE